MIARNYRRWALVLALAAFPSRAHAHPVLVRSVPAKDATLTATPSTIRLTFSESVEWSLSTLTLEGPGGASIALGKVGRGADSAQVIVAAIGTALPNGTYTVKWRAAGKDGHGTRGQFSFVVATAAKGAGEHEQDESAPFDSGSPLYVAVRFVRYAGLLSLIGAAAFALGVLTRVRSEGRFDAAAFRRDASARARTVARWSASILLASSALRLAAQVVSLGELPSLGRGAMYETVLLRTTWGHAWLLEVGATLVALWGLTRARPALGWRAAAFAAPVLALAAALSGHAVAVQDRPVLAITSDTLHVLSASGWVGSLLTLFVAGIPAALALGRETAEPAVRALVESFSPTALAFAGLLALSGALTAWLHLGSLSALWGSTFGRTLMVKLALLGGVAGTGAYNWRRVRPALGRQGGAARLRTSAAVELAFATAVVAVTAVLVATPTPMDAVP